MSEKNEGCQIFLGLVIIVALLLLFLTGPNLLLMATGNWIGDERIEDYIAESGDYPEWSNFQVLQTTGNTNVLFHNGKNVTARVRMERVDENGETKRQTISVECLDGYTIQLICNPYFDNEN